MTLHGAGIVVVVGGIVLVVGGAVVEVGATVTTVLGNPLTAAVEGVANSVTIDAGVAGRSADAAAQPVGKTPTRATSIQGRARAICPNRTAAVSESAVGADGGGHSVEYGDQVVGGDLDVEPAFTAADEDGVEQHTCLVDDCS